MAAGRGKFSIPAVEDLEDKNAPSKSISLFRNLRHASSEDVGHDLGANIAHKQTKAMDNSAPTSLQAATQKTQNLESSRDERPTNSDEGKDSNCMASKSGENPQKREKIEVGKNFGETFAFLKETRHYTDTSAKITELKEKAKEKGSFAITAGAAVASKPKSNAILVNQRQKGNPILKHVKSVPWEFGDIVPDYVLGTTTCALFLSLRYHQFNPNYIHGRLRELGPRFELRILLVQVDVKDPHHSIQELSKMAIMAECTLILAWSPEEAGRYLETYKVYENKPADALQGQSEDDYHSRLTECLTTLKGVNKTDVVTLSSTFGNLVGVSAATRQDFSLLPGFGPLKARRLHDLLHEPLISAKRRKGYETADNTK